MTAEEIRATKFSCDTGDFECAEWLREIAAQLAERNEREQHGLEHTVKQLLNSGWKPERKP